MHARKIRLEIAGWSIFSSLIFISLVFLAIGGSMSRAQAQWIGRTSGPDVFGNTKASAVAIGNGDGFIIECDSKGDVSVNVLIETLKPEDVNAVPAKMLVQVDQGKILHFSANSGPWNDKYMAITTDGHKKKILSLIKEISGARSKVDVGIRANGHDMSMNFDAIGSTAAMAEVLKVCSAKKKA